MDEEADLIERARTGDIDAWAELYERHGPHARRFAIRLGGQTQADDLVSTAFERTFDALDRGGGPHFAFRPYLLTAVRNAYVSHIRSDRRFVWTDDHERLGATRSAPDPTDAMVESSVLAEAFGTLPDRWQAVLWQSLVEGESVSELAERYGMTKNAVAALTYRAREGLRQAYLAQHIARATDGTCREIRSLIPAYHRRNLSKRCAAEVRAHLDACRACTDVMTELCVIMSPRLGLLLGPAVLGLGAVTLAAAPVAVVAVPVVVKAAVVITALCAAAAVAAVVGVGAGRSADVDPAPTPPSAPVTRIPSPPRPVATTSPPVHESIGATKPTTKSGTDPDQSTEQDPIRVVASLTLAVTTARSVLALVLEGEAPRDQRVPITGRFRPAVHTLGALSPSVLTRRPALGDTTAGSEDRRRTSRPSE